MIVHKIVLRFPHLSMWLVIGNSGTHWQDFFLGSHTESAKPQSSVISHLSPNFLFPRRLRSIKQRKSIHSNQKCNEINTKLFKCNRILLSFTMRIRFSSTYDMQTHIWFNFSLIKDLQTYDFPSKHVFSWQDNQATYSHMIVLTDGLLF